MTTPPTDWVEANQRYLSAALAVLRAILEQHAGAEPGSTADEERALAEAEAALPAPAALESLATTFDLSRFEQMLLLLCAGMELDGRFAALCARAQGDPA